MLQPEHLVFEEGPSLAQPRPSAGPKVLDRRRGRLIPSAALIALMACNGHRAEVARQPDVNERTLCCVLQTLCPEEGS